MDVKQNTVSVNERNRAIIRCNLTGIVMNLLLSAGKIITGYIFHAHAVMLDGVNSLSDLVSAVFSAIGVRLGMKSADSHHPFGYGRVEYISSFLITTLILYIGVRTIIESFDSILHPHDAPNISPVLFVIMIISLIAKLVYGLSLRKKGKALDSEALYMTGTESLGDSLIAAAVLVSFLIYRFTGTDIEHYLCIVISLMIIGTGIRMIRDCMTKIIGASADPALRKKLVRDIMDLPGVLEVTYLFLHNYGEGILVGSLDISVEQSMNALEITKLSRLIKETADASGITITSVGITGTNTADPEAVRIWDTIIQTVLAHGSVQRVHSFFVDFQNHEISFSVVEREGAADENGDLDKLREELQKLYPGMKITIVVSPERIEE